jgi:hypothetical protein
MSHSLVKEGLEDNNLITGFNEAHEGTQHSLSPPVSYIRLTKYHDQFYLHLHLW